MATQSPNEPTSGPVILMLAGAIGSGKSRVAEFLTTPGGPSKPFEEYTFAGPLKKIALELGFSFNEVYGTQEEKLAINPFWGVSGRKFLQTFGSEICRDALPKVLPEMKFESSLPGSVKVKRTLWCRLAEKYIQDSQAAAKANGSQPPSIVFSDGRFEDEADFVSSVGGYIIRIERPTKKAASADEAKAASHQSENGVIHPDYTLINDGNLLQLKEAVDFIVQQIRTTPAVENESPEKVPPLVIQASTLPYDRPWLLARWKELIKLEFYSLFNCPFCQDPCGWFYQGEELYYKSGCNCVAKPTPPYLVDDDEQLLRHLDSQAPLIIEWFEGGL